MDIANIGEEIQAAYLASGNKLGYRFLYCQKERLTQHNGILVLGLNPGGDGYGASLETPEGLAYKTEAWGGGRYVAGESPIQKQILLLLSKLNNDPENCLASNLVFFRSPSWKDLVNSKQSVATCCSLWKSILQKISGINTIIYIGKKTFDHSRANTLYDYEATSLKKGNLWAGGSWCVMKDKHQRTHIVLPHLSRWQFINEESSSFKELLAHT